VISVLAFFVARKEVITRTISICIVWWSRLSAEAIVSTQLKLKKGGRSVAGRSGIQNGHAHRQRRQADRARLQGRNHKIYAAQERKEQEKVRAGPVKPQGKQTVKELIGQNQGVSNIEVSDKGIKDFDRIARKFGVDYAIKKDRSVSPPKYLIFFKARDADALTAAFTEYTAKAVNREKRPSLLQKLREMRALVPELKPNKVRTQDKGLEL
jgi:hypothetical protein